jgi:hypothetical protein
MEHLLDRFVLLRAQIQLARMPKVNMGGARITKSKPYRYLRPANAAFSADLAWVRRHVIIFAALVLSGAVSAAAEPLSNLVPLPPERPAEANVNAAEIVPSPCRVALEAVAQITPLPERKGPGACGGADMVSLEAVRMPDGAPVTISPAAELRCEMATQMANWIRTEAAPAFAPTRLTGVLNYDSYDCRGRNRVAGAKISEHGKGNALDIRAFVLAGNKMVSPVDYRASRELRENLKASACKSFTTVLGPGSDGYHEQHIHFDIAERRGGYRICQWDVRDKPVEVAAVIPLPRARPDETFGKNSEKTGDAEPGKQE